jgi:hypothetical protein
VEPSRPVKLVVAHPEGAARRVLQRLVGATPTPVEAVGDAAALRAAVDADTIAIVDIALARNDPELRRHPARAWVAVTDDEPAAPSAVDELLARGWCHVVAHPMPVLAEELLVTVQKLRRGEAFGLDKYISWSAEVRSRTLDDTRQRDHAVAALTADLSAVGLPERVATLAGVIADELIANALYLAPLDDRKQRYRAAEAPERGAPQRARPLRGRDVVTLRWASDARYVAIEVRDRWGTLELDAVTGRLVSGKSAAAAGVRGVGLALAYACCNQLVIDLEPDVMTEVIALLDIREPRIALGRSASYHAFAVDAPPEPEPHELREP